MGNTAGKQVASKPSESATDPAFDWGPAPEGPSEAELERHEELVLQTWASCKAKPVDAKLFRSDVDEAARRQALQWRKRASFMELDCGEDSFFVANTYHTVGVADGVAGWREEGVNPADFPNELMKNAKHFAETHRDVRDPEVIIERAFEKVKGDKNVRAGSSTFCIASLIKGENNRHFLDIANLGDAGCIVIRDHDIIYRVHEKVHGFNAPLQLAVLPEEYKGRCYADNVADCVRETFEVQEGDVVVMGTDGLFDNRFCSQLAMEAGWVGDTPQSVYEGIPVIGRLVKFVMGPKQKTTFTDPYRVVQRLCTDAYKTSLDKHADTPWADALKYVGVEHAEGGKVDDITVLLTKVTSRSDMMDTTMW
jgi:protein phosphatase PTC7